MSRAALAAVLLIGGISTSAHSQNSKSDRREFGVYPIVLSESFNCNSLELEEGPGPFLLKFDAAGAWKSSGLRNLGSQGKYTIRQDRVVLHSAASHKSEQFRMFREDNTFLGVVRGSRIALTSNLDVHRNLAEENILTCSSPKSKPAVICDCAPPLSAGARPWIVKTTARNVQF